MQSITSYRNGCIRWRWSIWANQNISTIATYRLNNKVHCKTLDRQTDGRTGRQVYIV